MRNLFFIPVCLFLGCHNDSIHSPKGIPPRQVMVIPSVVILSTDTSLRVVNGIWYRGEQKFSGFVEAYFLSGKLKSKQGFYEGKEEGLLSTYYENGNKDTQRYYHAGEKDSVNQGWWANGNPRFVYHFRNGMYEGDFKEWYVSGKPLKHLVYHNSKEQSGTGWRENGKVYMSFVVKDGRLYGLINPNLCYSLKNERGEFVRSE
jgi:hypothetical protein